MSSKEVGIEQARKTLGDLVTAAQQGADIVLTRNGKPAARIVPEVEMTTRPYGTLVDADSNQVIRPATIDEWADTVVARTRRNMWELEHFEHEPWTGPDDVINVDGRRCRVATVYGDGVITPAWMWRVDDRLTVVAGNEVIHEESCSSDADARATAARLRLAPLTTWGDWREHGDGYALVLKTA